MTETDRVLTDVCLERVAQDRRWGGPQHDDCHTIRDWVAFIVKQLGLALTGGSTPATRSRLVSAAALAVAAVEQIDRFNAEVAALAKNTQPMVMKTEPQVISEGKVTSCGECPWVNKFADGGPMCTRARPHCYVPRTGVLEECPLRKGPILIYLDEKKAEIAPPAGGVVDCKDCPWFSSRGQAGESWCLRGERATRAFDIPEWCPLRAGEGAGETLPENGQKEGWR